MKLYVDMTDMLTWFHCFKHPSGIQRVLVNLARLGLPEGGAFVRVSSTRGVWEALNYEGVVELAEYVTRHAPERPVLDVMLRRLAVTTTRPRISRGDVIYVSGAFWGSQKIDGAVLASKRVGAKVVCTVYDLIPILRPEFCPPDLVKTFVRAFGAMLPLADAIHAISEHTAGDVREYLRQHGDERIPVFANPLAHALDCVVAPESTTRIEAAARRPFVLCVSPIDQRKNQRLLIDVWERLAAELGAECPRLVLVGGSWGLRKTDVAERAESKRLHGLVSMLQNLSDAEVSALYERSMFTAYPAHYEGWGLPVGEALVRGKPCVASRASSIPEVGGDFVDYFDPESVDEAHAVISAYVREPALLSARADRIRREFVPRSWVECFDRAFLDLSQRFGTPARRRGA